jgi:coproporphyrinogen III oxidase-like Fe-S oxidoreductase
VRPEEAFASALAKHLDTGLLERAGERLRLTPRGVFLANEVFVDLLPDEPSEG